MFHVRYLVLYLNTTVQSLRLVNGDWKRSGAELTMPDPLNGEGFMKVQDTKSNEIQEFVDSLNTCPKSGRCSVWQDVLWDAFFFVTAGLHMVHFNQLFCSHRPAQCIQEPRALPPVRGGVRQGRIHDEAARSARVLHPAHPQSGAQELRAGQSRGKYRTTPLLFVTC